MVCSKSPPSSSKDGKGLAAGSTAIHQAGPDPGPNQVFLPRAVGRGPGTPQQEQCQGEPGGELPTVFLVQAEGKLNDSLGTGWT